SSQESVRLLLNSKSSRFPDGLANSSGLVGKYLTDSVSSGFSAQVPALEDLPPHNEDGTVGQQAYIPWSFCQEQLAGKLDFPGGYKLLVSGGRRLPDLNAATKFDWLSEREGIAFGADLREDARRYYGSIVGIGAQGAMVPNDDCFAELDPEMKDQWGIPALRFHWKWADAELKQIAHQQEMMGAILDAMGGRYRRPPEIQNPIKAVKDGGSVIHEVGGAIMGADPAKSVTDAWSRTWDVPNLIVADGATFPNTADKNPTLTILALAWRAADHLVEEMKRGNL
ncbi:MAG: GMC family oxidoreductase, partial [Verrucomicrobiae bacterium]|nr:GMC family oxidoreductase [Verrucomicrobiae bacterium]